MFTAAAAVFQRLISTTDRLTYQLYRLTPGEINLVEQSSEKTG